jgi:hypothetical protein
MLFFVINCGTFFPGLRVLKPTMSFTTNFLSFYIPYVPKEWDEESIRALFTNLSIGLVDRVDFFDAGNWSWAFSAFVHLKYWGFSHYADLVHHAIETTGQWKLHIANQPGKYLVLKKMTCEKIPSTHLNVHQLAAKMTEMEREIHELRTALTATRVAEDVLRNNFEGDLEENADFYTKYDDGDPLSMAELVGQSQEFDASYKRRFSQWDEEISETSSQGSTSSAKRMRVSEELCGNN